MVAGRPVAVFRMGLDIVATSAAIVVAGLLLAKELRPAASPRSIAVPAKPLELALHPSDGDATAKVGLLVFSDFQCPYCKRLAQDVWPTLEADYVRPGKLRVYYSNLPLENLHPLALRAARIGVCANNSGLFWSFHDQLFAAPGELTAEALSTLGANVTDSTIGLEHCVESTETSSRISADLQLATSLGIAFTPVIMIGQIEAGTRLRVQRVMAGAQTIEKVRQMIDPLLAAFPSQGP